MGAPAAPEYPGEHRKNPACSPPDERIVYSKLMEHLDDMEMKKWHWLKYISRATELFIFSGLVAALVCSLAVEPTNEERILHLRIWQWVAMALLITAIFSVVPFLTFVVCLPLKFLGRTHKYWVFFIRRLKRSVDYTLWSCLVLLGWYAWFRPRLKHVYGEVSVIACQQTTRLLIALCIGTLLWTLKRALYLKLRADLHYHQLFDRITQTIVFLSGFEIMEIPDARHRARFLSYDEEMLDEYSKEGNVMKQMGTWIRYVLRRKWKGWRGLRSSPDAGRSRALEGRCSNIWIDVLSMKRENAPIWILVRLTQEYFHRMEVIRAMFPDVDELIKDDDQTLEKAKRMFRDITRSQKQDIHHHDEIEVEHLEDPKYNLSKPELEELFKPTQNLEDDHRMNQRPPYKPIQVDRFLTWAVRVHKNCWGLEQTLMSSRIAFVKLNRMMSAFLMVVVVIIWLLLSKIVNTGQLALLFAPFLAASFMFENSSKNMLNGIIFAFAMHPFDVGDRVIIDDIQMRVKKLNILTSVFYKYDTGAEVIFPNSKLATTKIVNLDITPDQSDTLDFLIDAQTPLEDIKDLQLKLQKLLDESLFYASGTKVVKNAQNFETMPFQELKMTIHFKYLVSYLTAQKKAARKSQLLGIVMGFLKEMEANKKEYPLDHTPYVIELTASKLKLSDVQHFKSHVLTRLAWKRCKVVLTDLNHVKNKIKMALYVGISDTQDHTPAALMSSDIPDEKNFFVQLSVQEHGFSSIRVTKDGQPVYPEPGQCPVETGTG